jgi:outer membrane protein OmpA-like peptidoglycan-associated protein
VLFAKDSATLSPRARQRIDELAATIRARKARGEIQVHGYTDNLGSAESGLRLSRQRAQAVAAALRPRLAGLPVTLRARGHGEADPVASNRTEAGRARNRRVTIILPPT